MSQRGYWRQQGTWRETPVFYLEAAEQAFPSISADTYDCSHWLTHYNGLPAGGRNGAWLASQLHGLLWAPVAESQARTAADASLWFSLIPPQ